jgi:hypothetical protein
MSQAAATPCISEPMFDASAASQSARKTGRASGPQAERERVVVFAVSVLVKQSAYTLWCGLIGNDLSAGIASFRP